MPLDKLWEQYRRILKDNWLVALFASQPFTSAERIFLALWPHPSHVKVLSACTADIHLSLERHVIRPDHVLFFPAVSAVEAPVFLVTVLYHFVDAEVWDRWCADPSLVSH